MDTASTMLMANPLKMDGGEVKLNIEYNVNGYKVVVNGEVLQFPY